MQTKKYTMYQDNYVAIAVVTICTKIHNGTNHANSHSCPSTALHLNPNPTMRACLLIAASVVTNSERRGLLTP
jgi:hypothetical protein